MRIQREWLGGSEVIDLGTDEGYFYFAEDVTQDSEAAGELIARMYDGETEIVVNGNEPEFTERYTVLS